MKANVGGIDRIIRIGAGAVLVGLAATNTATNTSTNTSINTSISASGVHALAD